MPDREHLPCIDKWVTLEHVGLEGLPLMQDHSSIDAVTEIFDGHEEPLSP